MENSNKVLDNHPPRADKNVSVAKLQNKQNSTYPRGYYMLRPKNTLHCARTQTFKVLVENMLCASVTSDTQNALEDDANLLFYKQEDMMINKNSEYTIKLPVTNNEL